MQCSFTCFLSNLNEYFVLLVTIMKGYKLCISSIEMEVHFILIRSIFKSLSYLNIGSAVLAVVIGKWCLHHVSNSIFVLSPIFESQSHSISRSSGENALKQKGSQVQTLGYLAHSYEANWSSDAV